MNEAFSAAAVMTYFPKNGEKKVKKMTGIGENFAPNITAGS